MSERRRVILDAGPALTFCAADKQRILHDTLVDIGDLCAPETVDTEVRTKARSDRRFAAAARNWSRLVESRVGLLSDAATDALVARVSRLSGGMAFETRTRQPRDLGEIMVMAHALVLKEVDSVEVVVLIDEHRAARQANALGLPVMNTPGVLTAAARRGQIADLTEMRKIYTQLRQYDDGLVHIDQTRLLHRSTWERPAPGG